MNILVLGAGNIGFYTACLLSECGDYQVTLADSNQKNLDHPLPQASQNKVRLRQIDATNLDSLSTFLQSESISAVLACLPHHAGHAVPKACATAQCHYFDIHEDLTLNNLVAELSEQSSVNMVPQCGLAPGFISILANHAAKDFDRIDNLLMRVGALPQHPNNALQYAINWSVDGLINEYSNPCEALIDGKMQQLKPLTDIETITIAEQRFEAFNTSGGLGTLPQTYANRIKNMNYKTIRYPGHCEKMSFLLQDLKLAEDRPTLRKILLNALPPNPQDVVIVYVSVTGEKQGKTVEETHVRKVLPQTLLDQHWTAIQVSTGNALAAAVDIVLNSSRPKAGLYKQEDFNLDVFCGNRFGKVYQ